MAKTKAKKITKTIMCKVIADFEKGAHLSDALSSQKMEHADFHRMLKKAPDLAEAYREAEEVVHKIRIDEAHATVFQALQNRKEDGSVTADALRAATAVLSSEAASQKLHIDSNLNVSAGLAELTKALEERKVNQTNEERA